MTALLNKPKGPHYYIDPDRDRGEWTKSFWHGPVAERLGLTDVLPRHFVNLWHGREPHGGKPLVKNHDSPTRVPVIEVVGTLDGTMKLPELAPDPEWAKFQKSKLEAYKALGNFIQDNYGWTRLGHGGERKERAELLMAIHPDFESRWGGAPMGHVHITINNLAYLQSGKVRALDATKLYRDQKLLNAVLNLELANQVTKRLGLRVERRGDRAVLPGNFDALLRDLSPASEAIKKEMTQKGFHSPKARWVIAQRQKPRKEKRTVQDLRAGWQRTGARHNFSYERLERRRPVKEFARSIASAEFRAIKHAEAALKKLSRMKPNVSELELQVEAVLSAIGRNLSTKQVLAGAQYIVRSNEAHALDQSNDSKTLTTKSVWKAERRTLKHAQALAEKDRLKTTSDPARKANDYLTWSRHREVVRPETIDTLLKSLDKGPRLAAHFDAFKTACKSGGGIQARLKAAEQAYREARKPTAKVEARTVYDVEGLDRIPTESLERLLRHARRCGAKVILREPVNGATKGISGILPQLLDLNRDGVTRPVQEGRPVVDHEMRFAR
ncbi:MAG: relaxase domain-containing protein [Gemmataceae bacterium]